MNGEFKELLTEFDKRLSLNEQRQELLWKAHNESAEQFRLEITNNFTDIRSRPCVKHEEQLKSIPKLWGLFWAILLALIGLSLRSF